MIDADRRLQLVDRLTAAFAEEIDRQDPAASVPWPWWPDVRTLIGHLGGIHGWVAEVVRTGERVLDPADRPAPVPGARDWYLDRRAELLRVLGDAPADRSCWVFIGADRTAGFWRRRMVFETAKHLADLRASGGRPWAAPPELDPVAAADGIDELLDVFLPRSRPSLPPLPGPLVLEASDTDRRWGIAADWEVGAGDARTRIRARAADLALLVWQRADPLADQDRFEVHGDREAVRAFRDAPIHP